MAALRCRELLGTFTGGPGTPIGFFPSRICYKITSFVHLCSESFKILNSLQTDRIDSQNFPYIVLDKSSEKPCSEGWALLIAAETHASVSARPWSCWEIQCTHSVAASQETRAAAAFGPQGSIVTYSGCFRISKRDKHKMQQEGVSYGPPLCCISTQLRALVHQASTWICRGIIITKHQLHR